MSLIGNKKNLKGFFIALAICLVAIGGVAVATLTQNNEKLPSDEPAPSGTTTTTRKTDSTKQAGNIVTDIPDERPETTKPQATTTESIKDVSAKPKTLFVLPLSNEVTKEFSNEKLVYSQTMQDWRTHNGVDFKGTEGQDVKVIADGQIKSVADDTLWGKTVVIDHGFGILSKYCGVTTTLKAGDSVKVDTVLGKLSPVPCESADGAHLHLEITVNGEYVNAVEAIGASVNYLETSPAN